MFKEVPNKIDFSKLEEDLLESWDRKNIFQRSVDQREGCPDWVFYDGPPGTNGKPHVGHMMQSALKDLWGRYKTMKGFRVLRKAGWDTHGLPVELTAEKELKLHSKRDIEKYGVSNYIDYCRRTVFRYKKEWEEAIRRCGRFIDLDDAYATLTKDYIQSDWWTIKRIWDPPPEMRRELGIDDDEEMLYKSYRISPYCPRCGTTLSNFETAQGYKDVTDFALFPKFRDSVEGDLYYVAWTTTAWTLLSNVALAVGPDIEYCTLKMANGERWIIADARIGILKEQLGEFEVLDKFKGEKLAGKSYIPLWDFLAKPDTNAHEIIADEYVTVEDGTGIVHLAAYGEDDFRIIMDYGLPFIQNVDENGEVLEGDLFKGKSFQNPELDIEVIKNLAHTNQLFHKEKHEHSYPFCFRCDSKLMYFPRPSWYIRTSRIKDKLLEANQTINWYPEHIKNGRFGKWLENNIDWNVTRERYWGSPLPIWTCNECEHRTVVASVKELSDEHERSHGNKLPDDFDPHKPYIDEVTLKCEKCGGVMHHENFVLDSWFNAGIMPWAQFGYPATEGSVEIFENQWPGEFICEAIDQTRGWFYTLVAAAVLAFGRSSYKNVICTELILDTEGHKMSKSRGNVVHPMDMFKKFGADAFRWVFFSTHPWLVKSFGEELMVETLRKISIPLWNAYSFFVTYANIDGWTPPKEYKLDSENYLDRWIISEFQSLIKNTEYYLDNYDVAVSADGIEKFIDLLTNWYIRRSRRRFWKSESDADKKSAYNTLHYILLEFSKLLAPYIPFISEEMYLNLSRGDRKDSVHLDDFPELHAELQDAELEQRMNIIREVVTLGRSLRNDTRLKIRQPLSELKVISHDGDKVRELSHIISDELNVRTVSFLQSEEGMVHRSVKPNYKTLGPKFGASMKQAAEEISGLSDNDLETFFHNGVLTIMGIEINSEDLIVNEDAGEGLAFRRGESLSVILDTRLSDELIDEGYAREFVNKIQNLRKEKGFNITDRIEVEYSCDDKLAASFESNRDFISREILAVKFTRANGINGTNLKINDKKAVVSIK